MKYTIAGVNKESGEWEFANELFVSEDPEYIAYWCPETDFSWSHCSEFVIMCWEE